MENIRKTTKKAEKKEEISAEEQFYFTKLFSQRDGYKKEKSCEDTKKEIARNIEKEKNEEAKKEQDLQKYAPKKAKTALKKEEKKEKTTKNGTYGK